MSVRHPLSPQAQMLASVLAFALPLVLWCVLSYTPFLWHPQVLVEDAGDSTVAGQYSFVAVGQRVDLDVFEGRNLELGAAGARKAVGERVNPIFLPAPHEVAAAFYTAFTTPPERTGDFWLHESLLHSCSIILLGFVYSMLLGLPVGLLCGTFPLISRLIEPFVDFVRYMPAPVFGALAVAVLGLGDEPKITIIFIGTFFQAVLVVANTTRSVDLSLIQAAQTLGANHRQLLLRVVVPAALPALYRDMRILLGWAWTYLVVAELIGEKSGISAFLYQQQRYRHFENVYAGIVMIGLIGLLTDQVLAFLGKYLFPWESGNRGLPAARAVADAVTASPHLVLGGVAGYEGAVAHDASPAGLDAVRRYLRDLATLHTQLTGTYETEEVVVSAGGSAYFDDVVAALGPLAAPGTRVLLRSGAYAIHDDGHYRGISPLGRDPLSRTADAPFASAMHAWSRVVSRPEPGLALLDAGKRDVPFDLGLPEPQRVADALGAPDRPLAGEITAVNDQHAFLRVDAGTSLCVGQVVRLGLSHPCTAFDRWRLIPMVDGDGPDPVVVDLVRTFF